jgi:hypothetical protein
MLNELFLLKNNDKNIFNQLFLLKTMTKIGYFLLDRTGA